MGLHRRTLRELKSNLLRYITLFFLIVLGMYVVTGLVGAAETIIHTVETSMDENLCEDGQFTVFTPLSQDQLFELAHEGVTVEPMFYMDFALDDGSVLRVFRMREQINLVQADKGGAPNAGDEALLEKLYAKAHDIGLASVVEIGGVSFAVAGVGTSPDYDSPLQNITDVSTDKRHFGTVFVSKEAYEKLKADGQSMQSEQYLYAYRLNGAMTQAELKERLKDFTVDRAAITDRYFIEMLDELDAPKNEMLDGIAELVKGGATLQDALEMLEVGGAELQAALMQMGLPDGLLAAFAAYTGGVQASSDGAGDLAQGMRAFQEETTEQIDEMFGYEIENLTSFLQVEHNPRIAASKDDVAINRSGGMLAGAIALVLFAYVISVFIVHGIDRDSEVIGTLYAMGVSKAALMRHYLTLPVIITALGGIAGTLAGFSPLGITYQMQDTASYFSFPNPVPFYPPYLLVYGLLMPPIIAVIVNLLVIRSRLGRPPLMLLRREHAKAKTSRFRFDTLGFISLFRIRQILREKRASLTVCGGMFIALLLLTLGVNCYCFITTMQRQNAEDINYEYMVSLKYPSKDVPADTEACYMKTLSREIRGYDLDVTLLGIEGDNPYFDFDPAKGEGTLTISSSMANKYNLKAGDDVILTDTVEDNRYVFTVDRVVPYSVGLYAFMDNGSMRALFGAEEDAYNVLLADRMPELDAGRIYAITTRDDMLEYGHVFLELMTPMIVMMVSVSVVVLVIVMYLMMRMMIDRSSFGISLMKIFGFNDGEVRKLYLDGNFFTVLVSTLICVPLAKFVMDRLYPNMIANVALGPDMAMPAWVYAAMFTLIMLSYFSINALLNRRLKTVTPAEVLKQRE